MTHLLNNENNTAQVTSAVNSTSDYPTTDVIQMYALSGGAVGGGIIGIIIGIFIGMSAGSFPGLLLFPFICAIVGFFIGFLPAWITGVILAKLQATSNQLSVLIVGFLVSDLSSLLGCCFFIDNNPPDFGPFLGLSLLIGVVGMCSSFIVGHWALPKDE